MKQFSYQALARGFLFPETSSIASRSLRQIDLYIDRYGRFPKSEFAVSLVVAYFLERDSKAITADLRHIDSLILIDLIDEIERAGLGRLSVLNRLYERRKARIRRRA